MSEIVPIDSAKKQKQQLSLARFMALVTDEYEVGAVALNIAIALYNDEDRIAEAEELLADAEFQEFLVDLKAWLARASVKQVKTEIGGLLASFPSKEELSAFTAILGREIEDEKPSLLKLTMACRELRRTSKFRPSIAEVLEALKKQDKRWPYAFLNMILSMPVYLDRLKEHLREREQKSLEHQQRAAFDGNLVNERVPMKGGE